MKRFLTVGLMMLATVCFAGAASAATVSSYSVGDAANGIGKSRHNMGSLGRVITAVNTTQICVFCHTPHHSGGGSSPLWNRSTAASTSYTAYGSTIAGNGVSNSDLGSATLACLSCHDGVTTFDNIINRPGKDTKGGDQGWYFSMPNGDFGPASLVDIGPPPVFSVAPLDHFGSGACASCHGHSADDFSGQVERFIIGPDLANDHPVSIVYDEGAASLRRKNTDIASIDLSSDLGGTIDSVMQNLWAVKGFISNTASINDLLRDNPSAGGMSVECSSCHDPHFRNLSYDEAEPTWVDSAINVTNWCNNDPEECTDGMFLRRVGGNEASGVCRTCHNK